MSSNKSASSGGVLLVFSHSVCLLSGLHIYRCVCESGAHHAALLATHDCAKRGNGLLIVQKSNVDYPL